MSLHTFGVRVVEEFLDLQGTHNNGFYPGVQGPTSVALGILEVQLCKEYLAGDPDDQTVYRL